MKHGKYHIQRVFPHCVFFGGFSIHLVLQTFSHTTCRRTVSSCREPFWYVHSVSWIQSVCCKCCKRSFQQLSARARSLRGVDTLLSTGTLDHTWNIWSSLKLCETTCVAADPHRRQMFCCTSHRQSPHAHSAHGFPNLLLKHRTFHKCHTLGQSFVFHFCIPPWLQTEA